MKKEVKKVNLGSGNVTTITQDKESSETQSMIKHKIFTGYIAKTKYYRNKGLFTILICRWKPKFYIFDPNYPENHQWWTALSPPELTLKTIKGKEIDWVEYTHQYLNYLNSKFTKEGLIASLSKCADYYNKDLVLLCYEKDSNQCHRGLLAHWLNEILDEDSKIREYSEDEIQLRLF